MMRGSKLVEKQWGKKVLVSGVNMITPLGLDLRSSWAGLVAGRSGIRRISLFDASKHETQIAGQLPDDFDAYSKKYCKGRRARQMARATRICYVCAKEAIANSGINFDAFDKERCAVILGAVETGHSVIYDDQYWILKTMPHAMSAWLSLDHKLEGPNYTVSSACTSGACAIAHAYDLIKTDKADVVITGGASSTVNPEHVKGFNELQALSVANKFPESASKPFSVDRDGFVIGEGAGVLILESEESAKGRGAPIYSEMAGYALTSETYNIMAPAKDGGGMAKTMRLALENAGVEKEEVHYINAHGTSTAFNDKYETMAIKEVFGELAYHIPVSSSKSMIGHTAAACGAIEGIITILTIDHGILTPTINYNPDPELDLDYVPNYAREKAVNLALSNCFGFGGCNATLVFKKYEI
jgi:3-oxoacyl-[acyl-carrier-protein] synthase II